MHKKHLSNLTVVGKEVFANGFFRLNLQIAGERPEVLPGQFVEIKVEGADGVMLRRPISVNDFNAETNVLSLLVHEVGKGTRRMSEYSIGDKMDVIYPLGNGFDLDAAGQRPLLVGGGVGVAPLMYLGKELVKRGAQPTFLFGARNAEALLCMDEFKAIADVKVTTEDASLGTKGFVTDHELMGAEALKGFTSVLQCGPTPMMKAVAKRAMEVGVECFASLENMMACGFGVCLCCVTDTVKGNLRVCADGPVFNVKDLKW